MYYYIYKITNINNQKVYIGSHQTFNLEDGYFGSGIYLKRAIKKYGKDNFKKEILEYCTSKDEMHKRETEILLELQNQNTYNLKYCALGGNTRIKYNKDEKTSYIQKLIENPKSPIGKKGEHAFNYGKKASDNTREKMKQSKQKYFQTAAPEDIQRWKDNVIKSAKTRCALMTAIVSKPIKVECKTTGNITMFKSKTECVKFFGVNATTLTKYIDKSYSITTEYIRKLLPYNIEYATK